MNKFIVILLLAVLSINAQRVSSDSVLYSFDTLSSLATNGSYFSGLNGNGLTPSFGQSFIYDCSACPILSNDTLYTFLSWQYGLEKFQCSIDSLNYFDSHTSTIHDIDIWNGGWQTLHVNFDEYTFPTTFDSCEVGYIANIYVDNDDLWIGFVHIERNTTRLTSGLNRNYAIGIASSDDQGESWTYHGDVIRPYGDNDYPPDDTLQNIGGVPYIVHNDGGHDYFYVYFNEYSRTNPQNSMAYPAVARARVDSVIELVTSYGSFTQTQKEDVGKIGNDNYGWSKHTTSGWTANGLTGEGARLMVDVFTPPTISGVNYYNADMHADAAFVQSIGRYIIAPNYALVCTTTVLEQGIKLLSSIDGITWRDLGTIESHANDSIFCSHSSIMPIDSRGNTDGSIVFDQFNIVYARFEPLVYTDGWFIHHPEVKIVNVKFNNITPILQLLLD